MSSLKWLDIFLWGMVECSIRIMVQRFSFLYFFYEGTTWSQEEKCCSPNATVCRGGKKWFAGLLEITRTGKGFIMLELDSFRRLLSAYTCVCARLFFFFLCLGSVVNSGFTIDCPVFIMGDLPSLFLSNFLESPLYFHSNTPSPSPGFESNYSNTMDFH